MSESVKPPSAIATIINGYRGELQFWVALVSAEVPAGVREVYKQTAEELSRRGDDRWLRDLESLGEPGTRADLDAVLEVGPCLAANRPGVLSASAAAKSPLPLAEGIGVGILDLLVEVGVELPPVQETDLGVALTDGLMGRAALGHFEAFLRWLRDVRQRDAHRGAKRLPARLQMIDRLDPKVFARREEGGFRYHPSFRLFLRSRLYQLCIAGGWPCRDPLGLTGVFHRLSQEQIGEVFDRALSGSAFTPTPHQEIAVQYLVRDVVAVG